MKPRLIFSTLFLIGLLLNLAGQNFSSYESDKLILDNGVIKTIINLNHEEVTGAYTTDKTRSGCHAKDHPMHKDLNESMLVMYQRTRSEKLLQVNCLRT